jgi:hypothetical protein
MHCPRKAIILNTAALTVFTCPANPMAAGPSGWKAGVARVDTTPKAPVRMAGYASRTSPSKGVAHRHFAKAQDLADADRHRVVLVTCGII